MAAALVLLTVALASLPAVPVASTGVPGADASRATPRAGRVFVGAYAGFPQPEYIRVLSVGCRVLLWNRNHTVARQLRPILRYYRTRAGHVRRITCGWKIPSRAAGHQLELL